MLRAQKRAPELRKTDTTWSKGCTPAQLGGCIYGNWYLLEPKHEKVLRGPEETEKNLYADYKVPKGAKVKAVRVNPGTVLVQARPVESAAGKVTQKSPNSYFVMKDDPVLTGADVKNPRQSFDEGAGGTGAPNVTFEFTGHGKSVFQQVTKEIAHRGQEAQLPGVGKEIAQQHFAVVLDGQLITTPSIDYTKYPEGIDAIDGLADLRRLHDLLGAGTRAGAAVGRAADQARTDLQLAGLGDARQNGAQPGPRRAARRLRRRLPVPAVLLPRAGRDRDRRPADLRRSTSTR